MTSLTAAEPSDQRFRRIALAALLAVFAWRSADLVLHLMRTQPLGVDFSCLWAGARTALGAPAHIYDFRYVTALQGWPMGVGKLRPFIYPPSALLLFLPLAVLPYWVAYAGSMAATGGFFLWASRRAGAPWWLALFPSLWLVAACGQITFAIAGLVLLAFTLRERPLAAGLLLGLAAALKPQPMLLVPLGLIAAGRWRTLASAAATVGALGAISSALWGPHIWLDWLSAVPRFRTEALPSNPGLLADEITVYAGLEFLGLPGALAYLLAPFAIWLVWTSFRRGGEPLARAAAAFGGALLITPYAMNYDGALLAPGVAALLARREDDRWLLYAVIAATFTIAMFHTPLSVLAGLAPALVGRFRRPVRPAG
jgi:hypothetical protein